MALLDEEVGLGLFGGQLFGRRLFGLRSARLFAANLRVLSNAGALRFRWRSLRPIVRAIGSTRDSVELGDGGRCAIRCLDLNPVAGQLDRLKVFALGLGEGVELEAIDPQREEHLRALGDCLAASATTIED